MASIIDTRMDITSSIPIGNCVPSLIEGIKLIKKSKPQLQVLEIEILQSLFSVD